MPPHARSSALRATRPAAVPMACTTSKNRRRDRPLVDRPLTWSGRWLAANIPELDADRRPHAYQSRYLSDGGRLFFNTSEQVSPQDHNHTQDVYEFEPAGLKGPDGAGVCTTAAELQRRRGRVRVADLGWPAGRKGIGLPRRQRKRRRRVLRHGRAARDAGHRHRGLRRLRRRCVRHSSNAPECVPQPPPQQPQCEALESCHGGETNPTLGSTGAGSLAASGSGNTAKSEVLGSKEEAKKKVMPKPLTRAQSTLRPSGHARRSRTSTSARRA